MLLEALDMIGTTLVEVRYRCWCEGLVIAVTIEDAERLDRIREALTGAQGSLQDRRQ